MDNGPFTSYDIQDRSFVAYIKREIHNLVMFGFTATQTGEIDIIVSELCSNVIKHAGTGEILYRLCRTKEVSMIEIICIDSGPGIKDLAVVMRDGFSSSNTLGHGLGAITRLSSYSQIYSQEGWGTVFHVQYSSDEFFEGSYPLNRTVSAAGLCVNMPNEKKCGDGFAFKKMNGRYRLMVVDGLGHGEHAYTAAQLSLNAFLQHNETDNPAELIRKVHQHAKKSRGLVGTIVVLDPKAKHFEICGVGNINTRVYSGLEIKNNMSYNGIIGLNIPTTLNNTRVDMERYQTLILTSDGIRTRWDLSKYPGILKYNPMVIAAVIYKGNARKTDDMSVVVAKIK